MVNNLEQHVSECDGVLVVFCPDMWVRREWSPSMCQIHIKGKCWVGPKHLPTQLLFSEEDNRAQGGTWNWGCYISEVCVCRHWQPQETEREKKLCWRSSMGTWFFVLFWHAFTLLISCRWLNMHTAKNSWSLCTSLERRRQGGAKNTRGIMRDRQCFCGEKMTVTAISCCCFAHCKGVGFARTESVSLTRSCKAILIVLRA